MPTSGSVVIAACIGVMLLVGMAGWINSRADGIRGQLVHCQLVTSICCASNWVLLEQS